MSKTKDLGHLAHLVQYDASGNVTLPAGITMHTNQTVASQSWVNSALSSYALSSSLGSYTPTSRTITINGTAYDLSADRSWTIAGGVTSFNTRTGAITLSSSDVTTALGYTPVTNARTITINGTAYDLSADRSWTIASNATQMTSPNGATVVAADSALPNAGHSFIHTLALGPGGNDGHILGMTWANSTTAYGAQIWVDTDPTNTMAFRSRSSAGSWTEWNTIIHSNNKSSHIDTLYYSGSARLWTGSDGTRNSGWAYHMDNGTGVHWPNNGWHLYPKNASDFYVRSGASDASIQFMRSGTTANYIHNASDNAIGFLSSGRSWILRVTDGGDAYTTSTHYAAGYRGSANVGGTGEATWHPAGIYCGGTMWQYGTQYRNGNTTSGQGWTYLDWNYGHSIVGVYASTRFQGVWAMGDSYKLPADGTSTGSLYGLAWSHPNAGGQAGYLDNHGLLVILNGTTYSAISNSIWARGNVTAYSDIRVKENIEIIENAMDKINSIRGVTFTRNDLPNTKRRHAGVIAQEIQKVLPEVIEENQSNGHLSVAYGNIVGLTIEGLKEHDIIIKKQAEEIKQLKEIIYGLTK